MHINVDATRSRKEIAEYLGLKTEYYARKNYIEPLIKKDRLEMPMPDKPKSKFQRYYAK